MRRVEGVKTEPMEVDLTTEEDGVQDMARAMAKRHQKRLEEEADKRRRISAQAHLAPPPVVAGGMSGPLRLAAPGQPTIHNFTLGAAKQG